MEVVIKRCLEGAKAARGITIVLDVFRASNTIIACLESGVNTILPVGELSDAYRLKEENPEFLLLGERGGITQKGFDYGNSPANTSTLDLKGKDIILTTSAGSQGIVYSKKADEIWIGSFANAQSIVDQLKIKQPTVVTLLAIGNEAVEPAIEDDECANCIKALLEDEVLDMDALKIKILNSDGAKRLRRLHQDDDLEFCLKLNSHSIIPEFHRDTGFVTL